MSTIAEHLNAQIEAHRLLHGCRPILISLGRQEFQGLRATHPESASHHNYQGIAIEERSEESLVLLVAGALISMRGWNRASGSR